ncbi:hypothetical protein [Angustibacter aerolatus]|nr:hypothetical protein [Angustibacter aerolatus]
MRTAIMIGLSVVAGWVGASMGERWRSRFLAWRERRRLAQPAGRCHECGHDWREHLPDGCSECSYEIEHEEPLAPQAVCLIPPPA